jgi:hypothetical protein
MNELYQFSIHVLAAEIVGIACIGLALFLVYMKPKKGRPTKFGKTYEGAHSWWFCKPKVHKVYQRFHRYGHLFHDVLLVEVEDKKLAQAVADELTAMGKSKDGRVDYEGVVR